MQDVKDKKEGVRLMGFGHRIYKNYDPRALKMGQIAREVLESLHVKDSRLDLALQLERAALSDPYFVQRKLYPNVDYYSGIMLTAINIPVDMFTVLFAVARTVGWVTQWKEMIEEGNNRIGRPRQLYLGEKQRQYRADLEIEVDDEENDEATNWTPTPPHTPATLAFIAQQVDLSEQRRIRKTSSFALQGPEKNKIVIKKDPLSRGSTFAFDEESNRDETTRRAGST